MFNLGSLTKIITFKHSSNLVNATYSCHYKPLSQMKNIYIVLITLFLGLSICFGQESKEILPRLESGYFPYIEDSSGYQLYYALEVYREGKKKNRVMMHSREGSYLKFSWKRNIIKGRWFFQNYPDTIVIKEIKGRDDLKIALNDISSLQAKRYDGNTAGQAALTTASLLVVGTAVGGLFGPGNNWSNTVFLINKKFKGIIHPCRET
jgi:hypothetical protein